MKNFQLFTILSFVLFIFSCKQDDGDPIVLPETELEKDIREIQDHLTQNGLTANSTESGLHYFIEEEGTGEHPQVHDELLIRFEGTYLDGTVFDPIDLYPTCIVLENIMTGWFQGIQLLKPGGSGTFYLPAELSMGNNRPEGIPDDAILVYYIEVIGDLPAWEEERILEYLDENGLSAEATGSGLHYIIEEQGTCCQPTGNDQVLVNYSSRLLDGTILFQLDSKSIPLWLTILGMQEGCQLLWKEGKGTFYIPSRLAHGKNENGFGGVPQNAILIYEIELLDF